MKATRQDIPGVVLFEPLVRYDERGYHVQVYSGATFSPEFSFVQDNISYSGAGVLRGLHLQEPYGQGKLVMAVTGVIWDVAVDVRVGSPTFGRWVAAELSSENGRQLFIPPGVAHGFCVLSDAAHVLYKCTELYHPECEVCLHFADPDLGIPWPHEAPVLSKKDASAPCLRDVSEARLPRFAQLSE